jgi:hypothetical protein|uniref:Uncharacterized protein n=1 Tax=viral metagenome TaxID=1070528 RepID=A0A6C0IW99_9ZZZZ
MPTKKRHVLLLEGLSEYDFLSDIDILSMQSEKTYARLKHKTDRPRPIISDTFDILPETYDGYDKWIKSTNVWCKNCVHTFDTIPIPVTKRRTNVLWVCCSFQCAMSTLESTRKTTKEQMTRDLLEKYYEFHGVRIRMISTALDAGLSLKVFGRGVMTISEYREENKRLNDKDHASHI